MRQTIIVGESFPELLSCLVRRVEDGRKQNPFHADLIVVPGYSLVRYLEEYIARRIHGALLNIHILPLRFVLSHLYPPTQEIPPVLSSAALWVFTRTILRRTTPLRELSSFEGMENVFQRTVDELIEAGMNELDVVNHYLQYQHDRVGSTDINTLRVFATWLQEIRSLPASHPGLVVTRGAIPIRFDTVHIYGFLTMRTAYGEEFFRRVMRDPPDEFIRYHPGVDSFTHTPAPGLEYARELLEPEIGATADIEKTSDILKVSQDDHSESETVRGDSYDITTGLKSLKEVASIDVTAAPGFETEVYHVAREIIHLMETGKIADLKDVGIILTAKDRMLTVLRRVFADYSIPYGISGTVQALIKPEILWLIDLFSLAAKGFPVDDVVSVLRSPWSTQTGVIPGPDWIRFSRKFLSSGVRSFNGTAWRSVIDPDSDMYEILETFKSRYCSLISSQDTRSWLKRLDDFLVTYAVPELGEHDAVVRWRRECEDFRLITPQLEEMEELGSTLLRCAVNRLIRSRTQIPYPPGGGVMVGSLEDLFGMRFDRLFILGCNRGIVPGRISEDPLLSDKTRTALSLDLGYQLQTRVSRYQTEKLMFLLMLRSAIRSVHITYSTIDEAGKPLAPSILLALVLGHDYAAHTMPYRMVERVEEQAKRGRLIAPQHILWLINEYDDRLRSGWEEFATLMNSEFFDIFLYGSTSRVARYDMDRFSMYDFGLTERFDHEINPLRTVHAWNDLDECPFRFFLRHVLGLEELVTPKETWWMDELETGNIVHRFFYLLCTSDQINSDIPPRELVEKTWDRTRESYLNTCPDDGFSPVRRYELERAGKWIMPVGICELELLRELRSKYGDIRISREVPLSDFVLTLHLGSGVVTRVPMNIRADRIDTYVHSDQARIIDYKVRSNRGLWEKDSRNLQLYLYVNAYTSVMRRAAQAEYIEIVRRGRVEDIQTLVLPVEIERIDGLFSAKLRHLGSRWFADVRSFPFTRDKDTCAYCRMKINCRRFDAPLHEKSARLFSEYWRKHAELNNEIKDNLKPYLDERYR